MHKTNDLFIFQATLLQVLEYHVEWLEEIGFSHNQVQYLQANIYSSKSLRILDSLVRNHVKTSSAFYRNEIFSFLPFFAQILN